MNLRVTEREGFSDASNEDNSAKAKIAVPQPNQVSQLSSSTRTQPKQQQATERDIDSFFKDFDKSPEPFGSQKNPTHEFELLPKTRTYKFRNLMYNSIAQKFRDYKNNGNLMEAY